MSHERWLFQVVEYERTEVCHLKLWWTYRCFHPKMIITASNSCIACRKGPTDTEAYSGYIQHILEVNLTL